MTRMGKHNVGEITGKLYKILEPLAHSERERVIAAVHTLLNEGQDLLEGAGRTDEHPVTPNWASLDAPPNLRSGALGA